MNEITRYAWVEIDKTKALNNFINIKKRVGENVKVCAVVKANNYGMGAVELSKMYIENGADMLAVAVMSEALELRRNFSDIPIIVLGYIPDNCYKEAVTNNITPAIFTYDQALKLNSIAKELGKIANIHIKVETGMNRIGFLPTKENADIVKKISELSNIHINGAFSHFAKSDEFNKTTTNHQAELFNLFIKMLEERGVDIPIRHIANSAAIIDTPEYYYDMVRPGIILLGYYPSDEVNKDNLDIKPCIKLKARVVNLKTIPKDSGVSYGYTYITKRDTTIGTIPIGYADGFSRSLSNNFYVLVKGVKCPVVGRVCMDQCMIDMTEVENPSIGDEVTIYGDGSDAALTVEDVAKIRDTIVYEVTSTLSSRLERIYV